ncbi:hypothetical protein [Candidatus Erwinia dacicola]|uniref:hypothetical protein n=1 Tax=Candidatus Erwinia dacicola TaxID=252393 RepID=UPI001C99479F|nr:hypothetical protein [Candidatus Erwinia dacicola]
MEWRKSDGCGCLSRISVPEKWLSGQKHDKNCIFILKPTHERRIKGIVRSDIHGWALSEEAIQSPNHEH